jgi:YD repeat-containing protein
VLDVNDGVVLFPGVDQLATLRGSVILQAQVSGTTVSSYSWNTSGISSDATGITGASTYQLSFQWTNDVVTAHVDPITLSVTDSNSHTETYTYDFQLPAGEVSSSGGRGNMTWPQSYSPDTVSPDDPVWTSDGATVDSNSGSLQTGIELPTYNPNVPAIGLTYDSLSANPMPIIVAENTLSASGSVPSQVSATLTFNGTVGTTYYYNTSTLNPGDVQQIALQANATSLATGRYSYSVQIVDQRTTNTTITLSGTAPVLKGQLQTLTDANNHTTTYLYDNAGNLTSETNTSTHVTTTFTYDYRNRLTEVTQGGTVIATYTYDALNRRIGIDDNGTQTWTVYDGTNPYADFSGSGTLEERYQYGPGVVNGAVVDQLLARTSASGTTAWCLPDKLGSVRDIVSSSGTE